MSSNVYYDPEKFGLEIVGMVDFSSGSYEFSYFVVWQDTETKVLYWAEDSGCSCPTPFEYVGRDKMEHGSPHDVLRVLGERRAKADESSYEKQFGQEDTLTLVEKLMAMSPVIDGELAHKQIEGIDV